MSTQPVDPCTVTLRNVRLSYPFLFEPKGFGNDPTSKKAYSAAFILDKKRNAAEIVALQKAIEHVKRDKWKGKAVAAKPCLRDGSEKNGTDGYSDDVMFVSARTYKAVGSGQYDRKVVDAGLRPLTKDSGKPYAGCYVTAIIRLWAQDNQYGKRVNASLGHVQFIKDGEPFGEKMAAAEDVFEEVPETVDAEVV
jgi:hypothetical protein